MKHRKLIFTGRAKTVPVKATGSAEKYTMNDSNILCLQCGSLIENNISVCPFCSSEIDTKFYFRLVKKVQDYLLFGYEYRRLYEIQYSEKKKIEKNIILILQVVLSFGLAWLYFQV